MVELPHSGFDVLFEENRCGGSRRHMPSVADGKRIHRVRLRDMSVAFEYHALCLSSIYGWHVDEKEY